jgi:hypothetical protein
MSMEMKRDGDELKKRIEELMELPNFGRRRNLSTFSMQFDPQGFEVINNICMLQIKVGHTSMPMGAYLEAGPSSISVWRLNQL